MKTVEQDIEYAQQALLKAMNANVMGMAYLTKCQAKKAKENLIQAIYHLDCVILMSGTEADRRFKEAEHVR